MTRAPTRRRGPDPASAARRELARALKDLALWPLRLAALAFERDALAAELSRDVLSAAPLPVEPEPAPLPERPLRLFVSCGEPSSEAHAVRLVERLRARTADGGAPAPELWGLGGPRLGRAGVELVADPTSRATIAGQGAARDVRFYRDLLERAARLLREGAIDAFVPVDAPALHVPLAHVARRYGVPTVHFVTPQYWAWGAWRVRAYRRVVDRALAIFPWEPAWFARHGARATYVGHPQVDALAALPPPPGEPGRNALVLLPGSRRGEIETHLPWMLRALAPLRATFPALEVLVAQTGDEHAALIGEQILAEPGVQLSVGDLHGTLGRARCALAVSGTVLVDLLHHRLPAVVVYSVRGAVRSRLTPFVVHTPWFASPNMLAGEEVLPEFYFRAGEDGPLAEVGDALARCYNDADWRARCRMGLDRAARRIGPPGATDRAAGHVLAAALRGAPPMPPAGA